jgi:outer membrane protein assembly factor BamB
MGQTLWSYYLGRTSGCFGPHNSKIFGVSSTPAISDVLIGGVHRTVLFVGGGGNIFRYGNVDPAGQAKIYALDAMTGQRIWERSLGAAPAAYTWSSPKVANGSVYIGLASLADCPLVQGKLFQLDPANGQVRHTFKVVPDGCIGGGIWGTAAVGPAGNLYVSTGNDGTCWTREPLFESVLRLSPDLKLLGNWQVPPSERVADGDFGSVPTLFMGTVWPGAPFRYLVGIANKNGTYYVFDRNSLGAGPLKRLRIGFSIAPSAWDGKRIYVGAGAATIQGTSYGGNLRAFDPNNLGKPLWEHGFAALAVTGPTTVVLSSDTGAELFSKAAGSLPLYGAASISHGIVWQGDRGGAILAYSVAGQ